MICNKMVSKQPTRCRKCSKSHNILCIEEFICIWYIKIPHFKPIWAKCFELAVLFATSLVKFSVWIKLAVLFARQYSHFCSSVKLIFTVKVHMCAQEGNIELKINLKYPKPAGCSLRRIPRPYRAKNQRRG